MSTNQTNNRGNKADNNDWGGRHDRGHEGRRSRGNHNRNPDKMKSLGKRFQGLNQAELKGVVIADDANIPTSQQFDTLYEALIVYGSTKNSHVATALRRLKEVTQEDLMPDKPNESNYMKTTVVDGSEQTIKDTTMRNALMSVWAEEAKLAKKQYIAYAEDLRKLFGSIQGQLDHGIKELLKSDSEWEQMSINSDTIGMLKKLRELCYRDSTSKINPAVDLCSKMQKFLNSRQDPSRPDSKFVEETKIKFDVLKSAGGSLISNKLITYTLKKVFPEKAYNYADYQELEKGSNVDKQEHKIITKAAEQLLIATVITVGCNYKAHRDMPQFLEDQYAMGNDCYPTTPAGAQDLLNQYRVRKTNGSVGKHAHDRSHGKYIPGEKTRKDINATALINHDGEAKTNIEEARQLLMCGTTETDVDHGFFLCQIGVEAASTNHENDATGEDPSIEEVVAALGAHELQSDDDEWHNMVVTKLHEIGVWRGSDLPDDLSQINTMIEASGMKRLHPTTIMGLQHYNNREAIIQQGETTDMTGRQEIYNIF